MHKISFLIVREGEATQAIVSLDSVENISADQAMQKVCECVAAWIQDTKQGQEAWEESGEDFNVGDLSMHDDDQMLINRFVAAGLYNVKVSANEHEVLNDFTYDTVLPRRSESFEQ